MAALWEPRLRRYIPTTAGNRDAEADDQIQVWIRPFKQGQLQRYAFSAGEHAKIMRDAAEEMGDDDVTEERRAELADIAAEAESAIWHAVIAQIAKIRRGDAETTDPEDIWDTLSADADMLQELAEVVQAGGKVSAEERPT